MNEVLKTILNRRSIRSYKAEQIKDEELNAILEAGRFAPSAMNEQPWFLAVLQNKDMLQKLNEACKQTLSRKNETFYNAPTVVLVFADSNAIAPKQDASLAMGNMMNAAASLGVASCWIHAVTAIFGTAQGQAIKAEMNIPEDYEIIGSVALGYNAGETPSAPPRRENVVRIIE